VGGICASQVKSRERHCDLNSADVLTIINNFPGQLDLI
jgi:hypothetical protein